MLCQPRLSFLATRTGNSLPRKKAAAPLNSTAAFWESTSRAARGSRENLAQIPGWGPAGAARAGPGSGAPALRAPTFRPSCAPGSPRLPLAGRVHAYLLCSGEISRLSRSPGGRADHTGHWAVPAPTSIPPWWASPLTPNSPIFPSPGGLASSNTWLPRPPGGPLNR